MADFYMRDVRSWRESTLLLSFEEKGYYDELLNLIYLYDGCLKYDDDLICRAMPVNKKVHLRLFKKLLDEGFVTIENGFVTNSRATQELFKINSKSTQNKVKADKRWSKSLKTNKTDDAVAMRKMKDESERENNPNGLLERETEFLQWHEVYPKAGNAKRAREEFNKALERIGFDELMKATHEYAEYAKTQEINYIKAPHNWLMWDCWNEQIPTKEKPFDPIAYIDSIGMN